MNEDRLDRLEYRQEQILSVLFHGKDHPAGMLAMFVLDQDMNAQQIAGVCEVMEIAHKTLEAGEPLETDEFEKQLLPHIPAAKKRGGPQMFIQYTLLTFTETGQWSDVCEHFRDSYNARLKRSPNV